MSETNYIREQSVWSYPLRGGISDQLSATNGKTKNELELTNDDDVESLHLSSSVQPVSALLAIEEENEFEKAWRELSIGEFDFNVGDMSLESVHKMIKRQPEVPEKKVPHSVFKKKVHSQKSKRKERPFAFDTVKPKKSQKSKKQKKRIIFNRFSHNCEHDQFLIEVKKRLPYIQCGIMRSVVFLQINDDNDSNNFIRGYIDLADRCLRDDINKYLSYTDILLPRIGDLIYDNRRTCQLLVKNTASFTRRLIGRHCHMVFDAVWVGGILSLSNHVQSMPTVKRTIIYSEMYDIALFIDQFRMDYKHIKRTPIWKLYKNSSINQRR